MFVILYHVYMIDICLPHENQKKIAARSEGNAIYLNN